jgi:crossover junction endodeoxyribonuclease RuvC
MSQDSLPQLAPRVLGLDPGLRTTGYAVVEFGKGKLRLCEAGVIRPAHVGPLGDRLKELYDGLMEVLRSWQPHSAALEELFSHAVYHRTAVLMGHARGVICLACAQAGVTVVHYSATQVKKMLTASGRAGKQQVQMAVSRELGLSEVIGPPDVADALALAVCHGYTMRGKSLMKTRSCPSWEL